MTAEELARLFHRKCEELGPGHDPPTIILPWDGLEEWQRALRIKVAAGVLDDLVVEWKGGSR